MAYNPSFCIKKSCMTFFTYFFLVLVFISFPIPAFASEISLKHLDLTEHVVGFMSLFVFVIAYVFVILEDQLRLKKSKPILVAACLIWLMIAVIYHLHGIEHTAEAALKHNFLEYSELFFFLLVAITYINAMLERGVFYALRDWLIGKGFSYRALFWVTGFLAFIVSPVADNLTTALIMCAVIVTVGADNSRFISLSCINIVVAANAGGAFSPFGDITTLMIWQSGIIKFSVFFKLFIPSLVNFLIPATIMSLFIGSDKPSTPSNKREQTTIKRGGIVIVALFLLTIITAVSFHSFLHFPPVIGMMTGLTYLKLFGFYLSKTYLYEESNFEDIPGGGRHDTPFDVFNHIASAEWDTLLFFYGVILSVGGLGFIGYLNLTSGFLYGELGATSANILMGVISAIVDNIPVMFAVLMMNPEMSEIQWLLVTLTVGAGGSLFSIGSAAGVALMGQSRGHYTFFNHLKWTPVIALGYFASIGVHFLLNG